MSNLLNELRLIKDFKLRLWVARYLDSVPPYFAKIPASSTGKYHPTYALGEGGLVRHTKAAVQIAEMLLQLEQNSDLAKYHDEIISALIIHDTYKQGDGSTGHTVFEHPNIASDKFIEFMAEHKSPCRISQIQCIRLLVRSHMGQWNTSKYSSVRLEKPITKEQQFVHMCDYLASRKNIIVEVE